MTTVSAKATATINPALAISLKIAIPVGQSVIIKTSTTGGTGPFSYTWSGLPAPCQGTNQPSITCTPNASGTYNISVQVKDATGVAKTSTIILTVV